MQLFINTTYNKIEFFAFNNNSCKLFQKESNNNHTIILYEVYEEVKNYLKEGQESITHIYIVNGPGSFTGTRIGVVFAKTLAMIHNIEITPVNYLKILYLTNNQNIALDARGHKYFVYDGNNYKLEKEENIDFQKYQKNPQINYDQLVSNLVSFNSQNVKEIKIEYLKNVL